MDRRLSLLLVADDRSRTAEPGPRAVDLAFCSRYKGSFSRVCTRKSIFFKSSDKDARVLIEVGSNGQKVDKNFRHTSRKA
jgi:hypothetical protein